MYLPYLVMFYNATVQESTDFSPFFIEYGREPVKRFLDPGSSPCRVIRDEVFDAHLNLRHIQTLDRMELALHKRAQRGVVVEAPTCTAETY